MDTAGRMSLSFCSEQDLNISKPKLTVLKEIPFNKSSAA